MVMIKQTNDINLVWDEISGADIERYEVYRSAFLPIIEANPGTKIFKITTAMDEWFTIGDTILVEGSTSNDGTYTITAKGLGPGNAYVWIQVAETIPSSTADGYLGNADLSQLAGQTKSTHFTDRDLPLGYYYYIVYGVATGEMYLNPSDIVTKTSPETIGSIAAITGLSGRRTSGYDGVEIWWDDLLYVDLKGYMVLRTLNPYDTIPTWTLIGTTATPKFTDKNIPRGYDATTKSTDVAYYVLGYDKNGTPGSVAMTTGIFNIPMLHGLRAALDYTSLNVYWDEFMDEDDVDGVAILIMPETQTTYSFAGFSDKITNFMRIEGPLAENMNMRMRGCIVVGGIQKIVWTTVTGKICIEGTHLEDFAVGEQIAIQNSDLEGTYTITDVYSLGGNTILEVTPFPAAADLVNTSADLTRNAFIIASAAASRFEGAKQIINIQSGTNAGSYTVIKAIESYNRTDVYVTEPIPSTTSATLAMGRLINLTRTANAAQSPDVTVSVPDYESYTVDPGEDEDLPTSPTIINTKLDPENGRIILNWARNQYDDNFLQYSVEMAIVNPEKAITVFASTYFQVAGDQTAYFPANSIFTVYGTSKAVNNRRWTVSSSTYDGANTKIYVVGQIDSTAAGGSAASDYFWTKLDKVKETSYYVYYPFVYGTNYYFRIIAEDRSGNRSIAVAPTMATWTNATGAADVPVWIDYVETYTTAYRATNMRAWQLLINAYPEKNPYFRRYIIYMIDRLRHQTPSGKFTFAATEFLTRLESGNTFSFGGRQLDNIAIVAITGGTPGSFTVAGDYTAIFFAGETFYISGSTASDGWYTVTSSSYAAPNTTVNVATIPASATPGHVSRAIYLCPGYEDWFGRIYYNTAGILEILAT